MNGSFGNVLDSCLSEIGVSKNSAADRIGCSRSLIQSVVKDERNFSSDNFRMMMSKLPFSEIQKEALRRAFCPTCYGKNEAVKLEAIRLWLTERLDRSFAPSPVSGLPLPASDHELGTDEITGVIVSMLRRENCGRVISNYSFEDRATDDAVYSVLCLGGGMQGLAHLVLFDKDNESTLNIDNIFSSVRFIRQGSIPLVCYSGDLFGGVLCTFSYFVVTGSDLLLFDRERASGIYICDPEIVRAAFASAERCAVRLRPLGAVYDNVLDVRGELEIISENREYIYSLTNYPELCPVADRSIIEGAVTEELPGREQMINMAVSYYEYKQNMEVISAFISPDGFPVFTDGGYVKDVDPSLLRPMAPELRKTVLRKYSDMAQVRPCRFRLPSRAALNVKDCYLCVEVYSNVLMVGGSRKGLSDGWFDFNIAVRNAGIVADFNRYFDYMMTCGLCLSPEYTDGFLADRIAACGAAEDVPG